MGRDWLSEDPRCVPITMDSQRATVFVVLPILCRFFYWLKFLVAFFGTLVHPPNPHEKNPEFFQLIAYSTRQYGRVVARGGPHPASEWESG